MINLHDLVMFRIQDFKTGKRPINGVWEVMACNPVDISYIVREVNPHIEEQHRVRMRAYADDLFVIAPYRNSDDLKDETLKEYVGGYSKSKDDYTVHIDRNAFGYSPISVKDYYPKFNIDDYRVPKPVKVLFNSPATIVFWADGTKTVVKCMKYDLYDKEKGFILCVLKKAFGDKSYKKIFKLFKEFDVAPDLGVKEDLLSSIALGNKFLSKIKEGQKWNEDIPKENPNHRFGCIFDIGDIVKLKHGKVNFKIINVRTDKYGRSLVNRYRIQALDSPSKYTTYEVEKRLVLVKKWWSQE